MQLTKELLIELGFTSNHMEHILCTLFLSGTDFRIEIKQEYLSSTNKLVFNAYIWKTSDKPIKSIIYKRITMSNVETLENLQTLIDLCEIDYKL